MVSNLEEHKVELARKEEQINELSGIVGTIVTEYK